MPRVTKPGVVLSQARSNFREFLASRNKAILLDRWVTGRQQSIEPQGLPLGEREFSGRPYSPRETTAEYDDLGGRSETPWAGLVVKSVAQTAYVDGFSIPGLPVGEQPKVWDLWQRNGMDAKQIARNRAAIGHGAAFTFALPAKDPVTGEKTVLFRIASLKRMAAFYDDDDLGDEWPAFAILADSVQGPLGNHDHWQVKFFDPTAVHYLSCKNMGDEPNDWTYISYDEHPAGVTPVVQYANSLDADGKTLGEIEPLIPLLRRVDQTTFDRLIVQRFGAWKIRYIAGMAKPDTDTEARAAALKLRIEDLLISEDPSTKFGTLDATELKQFIESGDVDLRYLSAVAQIPPHHLLGLSANLQAEALAAAEAGLQRKSYDFKILTGESDEKLMRLGAAMMGWAEEARAWGMKTRWKDTESRSLVQTANALGIISTALKVPVEMLWEKIPGWSDEDTNRAKSLIESGQGIDALMAELERMMDAPPPGTPQGANGRGGSEGQ